MGSAANCSLEGAGGASFLPTGSAPGRGACPATLGSGLTRFRLVDAGGLNEFERATQ